jgi:hypothetical protein
MRPARRNGLVRGGGVAGACGCQELVRAAAADFEGFYAARPRPAPGRGLVLSCDGKGIRMRPGQLRPRAELAARTAAPKQDGRCPAARIRELVRLPV